MLPHQLNPPPHVQTLIINKLCQSYILRLIYNGNKTGTAKILDNGNGWVGGNPMSSVRRTCLWRVSFIGGKKSVDTSQLTDMLI